MIRLFVALPLPDSVRRQLQMMASGLEGARWTSPANMHLTLRFIGEVDEVRAEDIDDALGEIREPAFEMALSRMDTFGRGHMVHTLWAGVRAGPELGHLQGKVERALVRAGLPPEQRKFTPHVTLARIKKTPGNKLADWLAAHGGLQTPPFPVNRFALYRSHQGHNGPHYEIVADYGLRPLK